MVVHIAKAMNPIELAEHLRAELKKKNPAHDDFCSAYDLQKRDVYCLVRFEGLLFGLSADTKYDAVRHFLDAVEKVKNVADALYLEDRQKEKPKLRVRGFDSPSGWYCYYRRQDKSLDGDAKEAMGKILLHKRKPGQKM